MPGERRSPTGPALQRLRAATPLVAIALIVLWGALTWRAATDRAHAEAQTRVALLERQVALISGVQFVIHDAIAVRLAETDPSAVSEREFHEFLRGLHDRAPRAYATGLVALDGRLLASSHEFPATSRVEGRGYMDGIAQGQARVIDRIALQANGIDAFVAATAVMAGMTPAAVVTAWPVDELARFMQNLAAPEGHRASVMRADGRVLVRSGQAEPGQVPADHPVLAAFRAAPAGHLTAAGLEDGSLHVMGYSGVERTPLLVSYEISVGSIRNQWLLNTAPVWAFLAAAGLFGFILFGMIQESILRASGEPRIGSVPRPRKTSRATAATCCRR